MLLFIEFAKLFCRDGRCSMLELLDRRWSSGSSCWSGKAQGKPLVGAAAVGSGMPETLRGFGLITGARRGTAAGRKPVRFPRGDKGPAPLDCALVVIPLCCCKFDTKDVLETFWLSYGEDGLMAKWDMPTFMRLSTLLLLESMREFASKLWRGSKVDVSGGKGGCRTLEEQG
jgi:hypothetical protein